MARLVCQIHWVNFAVNYFHFVSRGLNWFRRFFEVKCQFYRPEIKLMPVGGFTDVYCFQLCKICIFSHVHISPIAVFILYAMFLNHKQRSFVSTGNEFSTSTNGSLQFKSARTKFVIWTRFANCMRSVRAWFFKSVTCIRHLSLPFETPKQRARFYGTSDDISTSEFNKEHGTLPKQRLALFCF